MKLLAKSWPVSTLCLLIGGACLGVAIGLSFGVAGCLTMAGIAFLVVGLAL